MANNEKPLSRRKADGEKPFFSERVIRVVEGSRERVVENSQGFLE